jgi:hypothetical protein
LAGVPFNSDLTGVAIDYTGVGLEALPEDFLRSELIGEGLDPDLVTDFLVTDFFVILFLTELLAGERPRDSIST